jgi:hypothetical protein
MLGLIRTITYSFSTLDSLLILYLTLVRPRLEHASTVWKSITSTNAKQLERILRNFVALCQNRFFTHDNVIYENFLHFPNFRALHDRRLQLDALYSIFLYLRLKCCPSLLDITGIRVLSRNFSNSSLFTATSKNYPSARYVSVANHLCKDVDIIRKPITSLKQILR